MSTGTGSASHHELDDLAAMAATLKPTSSALVMKPSLLVEDEGDSGGEVEGATPAAKTPRRLSVSGSTLSMRKSVNNKFEGKRAVFVSDMSGFTRITRRMGIIHFASLIIKMRELMWPLLVHFGAVLVQPVADNMFAVFERPEQAVRAAAAAARALAKWNAEQKDRDCRLNVSGMGISWGDDVRDLGHALHGVPVQEAFVLGEDVASGGEVLLSMAAYEAVKDMDFFAPMQAEKRVEEHPNNDAVEGGLPPLQFFAVANAKDVGEEVAAPEFTIPEKLGQMFLELSRQRLADLSLRSTIDSGLHKEFMSFRVALMFGTHGEEALTVSRGLDYSLEIQAKKHELIDPVFQDHKGLMAEPSLVFFRKVEDAFLAAIQLRHLLHKYNAENPEHKIPVDCIGLHCGDVLIVPGTDIHWGDAVNTASKFAEDVGRPGQVLLSNAVHAILQLLPVARQQEAAGRIRYEEKKVMVSKVELEIFELFIGKDETEERAVTELMTLFRRAGKGIASMQRLGSNFKSNSPADAGSTRSIDLANAQHITGMDDNNSLRNLLTPKRPSNLGAGLDAGAGSEGGLVPLAESRELIPTDVRTFEASSLVSSMGISSNSAAKGSPQAVAKRKVASHPPQTAMEVEAGEAVPPASTNLPLAGVGAGLTTSNVKRGPTEREGVIVVRQKRQCIIL